MNWRNVYRLSLFVVLIVLVLARKHMPVKAFGVSILIVSIMSVIPTLIASHKRTRAAGLYSGVQKVSTAIIYLAGALAILALFLVILHVGIIGRSLLSWSLVLFIAGCIVGIFAPVGRSVIRISREYDLAIRTGLYLSCICAVLGVLLRINRYPIGRVFMFGGVAATIFILILLIVYGKLKQAKK